MNYYLFVKISFLAFSLLFFSCRPPVNSQNRSKKKVAINKLFNKTQSTTLKKYKNFRPYKDYALSIHRMALKKPFLLITTKIDSPPWPYGITLQSKIVYFTTKGNKIFLFENTSGQLAVSSLKTQILLAEFPITEKSLENYITFDFKGGINQLFYVKDVYNAQDGEQQRFKKAFITHSYIDSIELNEDDLTIKQYIRARTQQFNDIPMGVKFTFTPYTPKGHFLSKELINGYLGTHPYYKNQRLTSHIMKQDISKEIIYYLDPLIPANFLQAVKEGIIYWNKVFDKEVIKVKILPKNMSFDTPGLNVIRWVAYRGKNLTKADISADPLTGEILQSTIYLTSILGQKNLKDVRLTLKENFVEPSLSLNFRGFEAKGDDQYNPLLYFGSLNAHTKIDLKILNDHIRAVTAHEVGHTLGLSHNFNASIHGNIDLGDYPSILSDYLQDYKLPAGKFISSSVMDYLISIDFALLGHYIKENPLPYDKKIVARGYGFSKYSEDDNKLNFCSDYLERSKKYHDCKMWDHLTNPIEGAYHDFLYAQQMLFNNFAAKFNYLSKDSSLDRSNLIKATSLYPLKDAQNIIKKFEIFLEMLSRDSQFISVLNYFDQLTSLNKARYYQRLDHFKEESILNLPKELEEIIFNNFFFSNLKSKISDFIEYKLSEYLYQSEKELLLHMAEEYIYILEREYLQAWATVLSKIQFSFLTSSFLSALAKESKRILFSTTSNHSYLYHYTLDGRDLRKSIIGLLNTDFHPDWSYQVQEIREEIRSIHLKEIDSIQGDSSFINFILREEKLFSLLN